MSFEFVNSLRNAVAYYLSFYEISNENYVLEFHGR